MFGRVDADALDRVDMQRGDMFALANGHVHEVGEIVFSFFVFGGEMLEILPEPACLKTEECGVHFPDMQLVGCCVFGLNDSSYVSVFMRVPLPAARTTIRVRMPL